MSVFSFVYKRICTPIIESQLFESKCVADVLLNFTEISKQTPEKFQLFASTILYHSLCFIANENGNGYEQFKIIIHDYIEMTYDKKTDKFIDAQINIISCILARLLHDYLLYIKYSKNQID